ncbi:MAG: hypothetical protein EOO75_18670 [Myxococcales bacterium]|nr:MAG: hypothetical protein EOO75_18670 [Myxococcales bacterium]
MAQADDRGAAASDAGAAPDIVQLRSGGLVRGTILELIPGESVAIRSALGDIRKFPMSEVTYAGPVSRAPGAAPAPGEAPKAPAEAPKAPGAPDRPAARPMVTINAPEARVQFASTTGELTLHLQSGGAGVHVPAGQGTSSLTVQGYERLCTAPCSVTLPSGTYRFAVGPGSEAPILVKDSVTIRDGDRLEGSYTSRQASRTRRQVAGGILLGGGFALFLGGLVKETDECSRYSIFDEQECTNYKRGDPRLYLGGAALAAVGAVVLLTTLWLHDEVKIKVVPGTTAPGEATGGAGLRAQRRDALPGVSSWQGLTLVGQF